MKDVQPLIVMVLEPKVSGQFADEVCRRLGLNRWAMSEATGFSSYYGMLSNWVGGETCS